MIGSVASVKGFLGFGVYAASKAALRSFARTWLNELKGRHIRVNVLSPGPVGTPDSQRLDKATREMFESLIPMGKMGVLYSTDENSQSGVTGADALIVGEAVSSGGRTVQSHKRKGAGHEGKVTILGSGCPCRDDRRRSC